MVIEYDVILTALIIHFGQFSVVKNCQFRDKGF